MNARTAKEVIIECERAEAQMEKMNPLDISSEEMEAFGRLQEYKQILTDGLRYVELEDLVNAEKALRKGYYMLNRDSNTTIMEMVKQWIADLEFGVTFRVTAVYNDLGAKTKDRKGTIRTCIMRSAKMGLIQKHGRHHDVYRKADTNIFEMNYKAAIPEEFKVVWPLELEKFFVCYPKNIIVIAGTKDSGKTGYMLSFIAMNMMRHEIYYFNSEMAPEELRMRLDLFGMPISKWNFKAFERQDNFEDVIRPNAVNVLDYMEINENFTEVGEKIKKVHDRLDRGIAIIGLQKSIGATYGRGRDFGIQRPRLYITLESGSSIRPSVMSILSAKNWREGESKRVGQCLEYNLFSGHKFKSAGEWYVPEKKKDVFEETRKYRGYPG